MNFSKAKRFISVFILIIAPILMQAEERYPNKPIEIIVSFGAGGSTDSLARSMAPYLSEILNVPVNIRNITGRGSASAIEAFLNTKSDGYTILCSAFSPFLPAAILRNDTNFTMTDLDYLNIQSYGNDIVAVNKTSNFLNLSELLLVLKKPTKKFKVAVVENSNGYLLLRLLFEAMDIPISNVEIYKYNSDYDARKAIVETDVDVIFVSSKGSEIIRDFIIPLAINAHERQLEWDVPTVNEALIPLGFQIPYVTDYMRGFAVHKSLRINYPERYAKLHDAFLLLMGKKSVQRDLKKNKVGGTWTGSENSTQLLYEAYENIKKYHYLLDN